MEELKKEKNKNVAAQLEVAELEVKIKYVIVHFNLHLANPYKVKNFISRRGPK